MAKLIAKQADSKLTEAEAIRQAKDGDAAAFEYLYKANCRRVYSVCLRMIKNPAEAEDLTQQAFLQLFRKIGTFRGESGFSTWLHRVTVNVVLMHLRRKKPTEIICEDLDRPGSDHEGPREHGFSDTSMLGAIERLNLKRCDPQVAVRLQTAFLVVRRPRVRAQGNRAPPGMFDGFLKIAASQSAQAAASAVKGRTKRATRGRCRGHVGPALLTLDGLGISGSLEGAVQ